MLDSIRWFKKKNRTAKAANGLFFICEKPKATEPHMNRIAGSVVQGLSNEVETAISCPKENRSGSG